MPTQMAQAGLSSERKTSLLLRPRDLLIVLLLTAAALLIHGYHPGSEDSETYLPGVEKMLHPELFPVGSQYFLLHSHLTFFPDLIAGSIRLTHLPWEWALFLWHVLALFLFLLACRSLMVRAFTEERARWGGVAMITALLTIPISGTALYIMDQYINPRNLIPFAVIFAIIKVLDRKYLQAVLFLVFAAAIHPFMTVFATSFCLLLVWMERSSGALEESGQSGTGRAAMTDSEDLSGSLPASMAIWPLPFNLLQPPSKAYENVASTHPNQFLSRWRWYEFLGALAPLAILYWFGLLARARRLRSLEIMCRALVVYGSIYFVAGLIISIPARLEVVSLLQPMRSLYVTYVLMFLFIGGFLGQFVLKFHLWRWLLLFVPLCAGMYSAQRSLFPGSAHVEWPWAQPRNGWSQAFHWIRDHTPQDAIFALDPFYMHINGEDENGFRAIAQRSQLADGVKDSGVVEMFPQIGDQWLAEVKAQTGFENFQAEDFERLRADYGVGWVVLRQPNSLKLSCPYENAAVKVCRLR